MGRLLVVALVVVGAGIGLVVANGPGKDKLTAGQKQAPPRESSRVSLQLTGGRAGTEHSPGVGSATVGAKVVMRALRFHPSVVHVRVGQAVVWVNHDDVDHTVFQDVGSRSGEPPAFASNRIAPGHTFSFIPRSPGVIDFVCSLHPSSMSGRIVVDAPSA